MFLNTFCPENKGFLSKNYIINPHFFPCQKTDHNANSVKAFFFIQSYHAPLQ